MPAPGVWVEPQRVSVGRGWNWIVQGFAYFKRSPWIWMLNALIFVAIITVLEQAPLFGGILDSILYPIFYGGFMAGCLAQDQGADLKVGHLFAGFKSNTNTLGAVGGWYVLGGVAIALLTVALIFQFSDGRQVIDAMTRQTPPDPQTARQIGSTLLRVMPVMLALGIPLLMTVWFAPALVMFHGLTAIQSMKLSFRGCMRNLGTFLLYGLLALLLLIIAALPYGLGLLVMLPTLIASIYAGYKEIFLEAGRAAIGKPE